MANGSKNPNRVQKALLVVLAVWALVSIIILVVWATSPDLKGSAQCRAELREATEKLEGAKVVFGKDKVALEEQVLEARGEQERLRAETLVLLGRLHAINVTLQDCRQENVVLAGNVSALQEDVRLQQQREANLTEQLSLQEERMEALQHNLTQAVHRTNSCLSLKAAAESQTAAAQSMTRACQSQQQFLEKQLQQCRAAKSEAPHEKKAGCSVSSPKDAAAAPLAASLTPLLFGALQLIT